ncbi:hypothetical protein J7S19_03885 [Corynebacterium pyruviciproducens]|nr:hypothetical protein [Corynebacterium pyruviciproducens]
MATVADAKLFDAKLRLRELTQTLYDVGDEIAEYVDHVAQAVADWDELLVNDCLSELEEIIQEGRTDSRRASAELSGMRHAMVSGLRAGTLSGRTREPLRASKSRPDVLTTADLALITTPLERTRTVVTYLREVADWAVEQTALAVDDLDSVSIPLTATKVWQLVNLAVGAWMSVVVIPDPQITKSLRGKNPPEFLHERARVEAIVARVARKQHHATGGYPPVHPSKGL